MLPHGRANLVDSGQIALHPMGLVRDRGAVALGQIVKHDHFVTLAEQHFGSNAADVSGTTSHKYLFVFHNIFGNLPGGRQPGVNQVLVEKSEFINT